MKEFYIILRTGTGNCLVKYYAEKDLSSKIQGAFRSFDGFCGYDTDELAIKSVLDRMGLLYIVLNSQSIWVA